MYGIAVLWVFIATGFTLAAKLSGMPGIVKMFIKLLSIGGALYFILDLLNVQY